MPCTRPIVAAVHRAPPATYGTPARTGSVSAECPSEGYAPLCYLGWSRLSSESRAPRGSALLVLQVSP